MGHAPLGATQGRAVIRHTPTDPWPDVRWDALALVGRLVFEVPEGWTATPIEDATTAPGLRLDRQDTPVTVVLRAAAAPEAQDDAVAAASHLLDTRPEALLLEASTDRVLVAVPDTEDVRIHDDRIAAAAGVRITVTCSARSWPSVAVVVDGLLASRWHPSLAQEADTATPLTAFVGRSRSGPALPHRAAAGVLEHLVRYRDRGIVPGSARRSAAGAAARDLGLVGRFGGSTEAGGALVGPLLDHDAVLALEMTDPGAPDPHTADPGTADPGTADTSRTDVRPAATARWTCWLQGRRCLVLATGPDGTESFGVVPAVKVAGHLLAWLALDPTGTVGGGEPVTITREQFADRSGPCPSDVPWFRQAWSSPHWRSVWGWSHEAAAGVHALLVPGTGALGWDRGGDTVELRPMRTATVVRSALDGIDALLALTDGADPARGRRG